MNRLVEEELRVCQAVRAFAPGDAPYFGRLRLESAGRTFDVLLGATSHLGASLSVVDWEKAPLAEVFFSYEEGEEYEVEAEGRILTGLVRERVQVSFAHGELVEVVRGSMRVRRVGGEWRRLAHPPPIFRTNGRGNGSPRRSRRSPFEVELDPAQRQAVALPPGRPLLVLGEAGFGKTTVALHRLVFLRGASKKKSFRAAVIVPTEGLRQLTALVLERMGAPEIEVWLYDRWAAAQARRVFPGLPRRESEDATAGVIGLKRHPALRAVLSELAALPLSRPGDGERVRRAKSGIGREHLQLLFGDRAFLDRVAAAANGGILAGAVDETLLHTHVQFSETAEQQLAHVDADRLETLDGRSLDDGTPMQDAQTIDPEDYAVLFELDRLRAVGKGAAPGKPKAYDCLVVDEAQELATLELALLSRSLAPKGTLVVAGDAGQQVDPTSGFESWPRTMAELGAPAFESVRLAVSYRCPPAVTALARGVLDPAAAPERAAPSPGAPVFLERFDNPCHLAAALCASLARLTGGDPTASVAVIARSAESARRLAQVLRRGLGLRLVLDGNFGFGGGLCVTCVDEVKGLEFDHVVIPDATARAYPDTPASRRALYTAMTRATRQLALLAAGEWSPVLPAAAVAVECEPDAGG